MATPGPDREAIEQAVVRGSELLKLGKLDDAQKAFRAALLLDADNPRILALLGLAHFRGNQFEPARAIYEELVERLPTDASHRLNLGLVYLKLGDSTRAINALEASRALDPSQGRAVSYLGLAYARAGRYAEAYRSFLLAGQNDLASEIESNLTPAERDGIHTQLQRSGVTPSQRDLAPVAVSRTSSARDLAPVIARTPSKDLPASTLTEKPPASMPAIIVDRPIEAQAVAPLPSHSESQQFVMPMRPPVATPADGRSMISQALDTATPTTAGTALPSHVAEGSKPPIPLSQLATETLVRPDDGEDPFEISAGGALVIRVVERVLTRLDGVHATGGDLAYEPAMRRSRGHQSDEKFDYGGTQLHSVSGQGYLIAIPDKRAFTAVTLDDDIFYLREDLVFAFQATLRWENGNVPGLRGRLPVVQFRGDGAVALRTAQPLVRVKLPPQGIVFVDAARLAGWIGRVIPRAVVPPRGSPMGGDVCVECTGEGVVLIDPVGDPGIQLADVTKLAPEKQPPPPPPAAAPVELDVVKAADWLVDDEDRAEKPETGRDEI